MIYKQMRDKFAIKLKIAHTLHNQKVIQNMNRIISLISEFLKRKLEQMIWKNVLERTMQR